MRSSLTLLMVSAWLTGAAALAATAPVPDADRAEALAKIHPGLRVPGVRAGVVIRLKSPSLVSRLGPGAHRRPLERMTEAEQTRAIGQIRSEQMAVIKSVRAGRGRVVAPLTASLNAVLAEVDTEVLPEVARLAQVVTIRPVVNHQLALARTVPAIGGATAHAAGATGEGIRVAILDSGVDYTHRNLGGPGTLEAYTAAYGSGPEDSRNRTRDGLFPTAKVVGGWDFVGEFWTGESGADELMPDEDPIDLQGHGTHVADILAGASADGSHRGVAPGATVYAFRTCSARTSACSGLAIMMALDAALHPEDPDNFGSPIVSSVDIINLSLGSPYGQMQDDAALVVQAYAEFGITVVCAAGNSGDLPYSVDSPGMAPGALSVAQTTMPGQLAQSVRVYQGGLTPVLSFPNTASLDWAPVRGRVRSAVVPVGRGCPGDAYPDGTSLVGRIAVIDRGGCDVSEKVDRAARAGAAGVLIVNNVPGDPPGFSVGGPESPIFVPTLVLTQDDGEALKSLASASSVPVTAYFASSIVTRLSGSMVGTSARGPSHTLNALKPDISAPGASVSAVAGSGSGQEAFSGTSGATPMIAGAAAVLQSHFLRTYGRTEPVEVVKSFLMNTAETGILWNPTSLPGVLAPVSRMGAGEVRLDRALAAEAMAYTIEPSVLGFFDNIQPSLSYGYEGVIRPGIRRTKTVVVENWAARERTFALSSTFRSPEDQATGAITVVLSASSLVVPAFGWASFEVTLDVDPTRLPDWTLDGGDQGGNGALLASLEYDGHVAIRDAQAALHVPWHILPRKASDLAAAPLNVVLAGGVGSALLGNAAGAGAEGKSEAFLLGGTSPMDYPPSTDPDTFGNNQALPDLRAVGVRVVGNDLEFGVTTYGEPSHPLYPAGFDIFVDRDNDGWDDLWLFSSDQGLLDDAMTGRTHVWAVDLATYRMIPLGETGALSVPLDADLNSANAIFRVPLARLGLARTTSFSWLVLAFDSYFTGVYTDAIGPMVHTLDHPRYALAEGTSVGVPTGGSTVLNISRVAGGEVASPSQQGFLLLHRQAQPGRWAEVLQVQE